MKTRNDLINSVETFASLHRTVEFTVSNSFENFHDRRARAYVHVSMHRLAELQQFLLLGGFKVNQDYYPGQSHWRQGVVEVQVKRS